MGYLSEVIKAAIWGERPPKTPKWIRWVHQNLSENYCPECLKLHDCWFAKENTPKWPHHPFCHCLCEDISYNDVFTQSSSDCPYSEFDPYLFDTKGEYGHGKDKLFRSWGYSVEDFRWLKSEIEKQGLEKYIAGEYALGKLNDKGQRLSLRVEIPRKDKGGSRILYYRRDGLPKRTNSIK